MSAAEKAQLRARALAARLQSGGDQDGITRNLAGVLRPHAGKILSGYWPMRGKAVPLIFRAWDGKALEPGPFGTSHPPASAPELSPRVLIVPLAAFDRTGNRIGYGGGYYDRTLEVLRRDGACVAIGLAFASQELQSIPVEAFDQRLDMIVTDHDVILPAGG